jgi:hypothetical protein
LAEGISQQKILAEKKDMELKQIKQLKKETIQQTKKMEQEKELLDGEISDKTLKKRHAIAVAKLPEANKVTELMETGFNRWKAKMVSTRRRNQILKNSMFIFLRAVRNNQNYNKAKAFQRLYYWRT